MMQAQALGLASRLASAWRPEMLGAALLAYWDAERADLVAQSGGAVSGWTEAAAGRTALQATGASQPQYAPTGFNGRPAIVFDGSDDFLSVETFPTSFPTGGGACEMWWLGSQSANGGDMSTRAVIRFGATSVSTSRAVSRVNSTGVSRANASIGNGSTSVSVSDDAVDLTGAHLIRGVFGGAEVQVHVDGVFSGSAAVTPSTGSARCRLGSSTASSPSNFWKGSMNAVLVTTPLNPDQAASLTDFLKKRGGFA